MKKLLSLILALALVLPAVSSRAGTANYVSLFALYDLDSTTDISCAFGITTSVGFVPDAEATAVGLATTSNASSATTTSVGSTGTFANLSVGDIIWAQVGSRKLGRVVTAKASANSITVNAVWTIPTAGVTIRYQKSSCGATSGWVPVDDAAYINLKTEIAQIDTTTGISFKIEGRYNPVDTNNELPVNLWPGGSSTDAKCGAGTYSSGYCVYTTAQALPVFTTANITTPLEIRLVMKLTSTDDGADTTTHTEQINATLQVVR